MLAYATFLRGLFEDPRAVSAPTPSGSRLSARLAAGIDPSRPGKVVELGPGTGVVTEALIRRGITPGRLILIESNCYFCSLLRRRFPRATVIEGDAFGLERHLEAGTKIAGIISGLPLLNFESRLRRSLVDRALECQPPGGCLVQLSYGWRPAVSPRPDLSVTRAVVWRNVPPAHIWTFRRRQALTGLETPAQ